jgi:hypothetical protein
MDVLRKRELLETAKAQIMNVKGVVGTIELNIAQCEIVARLEEKAMENVLGGMGRGKNEGVKESLSREVTMVLFTDISFEIPKDKSIMELVSRGEIVGTTTMDMDKIDEFKKDERYVVISDFLVLKKDVKIHPGFFAGGDAYFVFHGTQIEHFSNIPEIKDHIVSFPSSPGFDYLKGEFMDIMDLDDPQLAGILIGFNLRNY